MKAHDNDTLALIQSTLHYQTDVPPAGDEPAPDDVANGIWGVIGTAFLAASPTNCHVDTVDVLEMVLPGGAPVGGTKVVNANGTQVTTNKFMSRGTCLGVNLHTAVRSRSSRGFMHLPGALDTSYAGGQTWGGGYLTHANTLAALLDDSFDLGAVLITHVNPVVYSRKRHVDGLSPFAFRVTSATVNPMVRYLRSRDTTP